MPIAALAAEDASRVLVVVNDSSPSSRLISEYYAQRRSVPPGNICHLRVETNEEISRPVYEKEIEAPIAAYLEAHRLRERILYIVTTLGLPLRVAGEGGALHNSVAAVDSELTLLYSKMLGKKFSIEGPIRNPFYGKKEAAFERPAFPIFLVTRLAAYDVGEVKALIDRSLVAQNRGKFVIDLKANDNEPGNDWLRAAARLLPADRVILDDSENVLYGQRDVIAYASWGSNDGHRPRRFLGFQWAPGAIATEFVSTNGRTFKRPLDSWNFGSRFEGSQQSLTADYIHEGATGCSGHVAEPYLAFTPNPEYLLPAYFAGRNLAESYYLAIRGLSWQNIVVGDPLCRLGNAKN